MEDGGEVEAMAEGETYKYLGLEQGKNVEHTKIKKRLEGVFFGRLKDLCRSGLNSKNLAKAINTFAIPVLIYSFGVIQWAATDVRNLEMGIRKILTKYRMHHPRASVERVTLPRMDGGRGIASLTELQASQIHGLRVYFRDTKAESPLHRAVVAADKFTPLQLSVPILDVPGEPVGARMETWTQKALHGRYPNEISQDNVDKAASLAWLTEGSLFPETEGFMIAIQDQVVPTKNYRRYIIKDGTVDDRCRRCGVASETIQHVISGCPALAPVEYKHRHDQVAKIIHQELGVKYGLLKDKVPYYQYAPASVLQGNDQT